MKKPLPTSPLSRSARVFALAAGVARHELGHQLRSGFVSNVGRAKNELRTRIEQARLLAEGLGRLKGAFMKAGQLLSMDASDLLPPEALEILSSLQAQAEPVDFEVIEQVLREELGEAGLARLEGLERTPAASASIGQVHRARVDGEPVAVKVQYPGIADSIDADIAILEKLGTSWLALTRRDIELHDTFAELKAILHLEADYRRERECLERFASLVSTDPRFEVPRSYPELSGARVLTMSWADGVPLREWIERRPSPAERDFLARALLDLYCSEFFRWGFVQTDPNLGNFLVRPEEERIVLLDFGGTLEYPPEFRAQYRRLLRAVGAGDRARVIEEGIEFELIDRREAPEARELFADMLVNAVEPFEASRQPFRFADSEYGARSRAIVQAFVSSLRFSPPPRRLMFLHRKLGGLFQVLKRLDAVLELSPYWDRMIGAGELERAPSASP